MEHYEGVRFKPEFKAYRCLDWWPYVDTLASYGHFFTNALVVLVAIFSQVSIFMCINVAFVCYYYCVSTVRISRKARENFKESGLLSQADLKLAGMITKRYNTQVYFEFMTLRQNVWKA